MKSFFIIGILFLATLLGATELDIDSYITQIKKASPQERVKLMNEFKQRIAQMNKQERLKSIQKMQVKMRMPDQINRSNMQTQHMNEIPAYQNMNHNTNDMPHKEFR